jgi:hypothetical protein
MESVNLVPTVAPAKPRKRLNARQALKLKRNRIQGRINKLRSELLQLEPVLAKVEQRMQRMDQSRQENSNESKEANHRTERNGLHNDGC